MENAWKKPMSVLYGAVGLLCLSAAAAVCWCLNLGTPGERLVVAASLAALASLAMFLLHHEGIQGMHLLMMLVGIGAAILVRSLCLDYVSLDYNDFLSHWYLYFKQNGGFSAIAENFGDYNVPYLYFMAAISYLNIPDLYLIKLFSILFDVLLAWSGLRLLIAIRGKREDDCVPLIAFFLLLFLPTVVLNGAYWGQCDSLYAALTVLALGQVLAGKNKSSVALLAIAFSFKLQTIFLIPLWGVLWLAKKIKLKDLLIFPFTYFLTILPALLLGKPLGDILGIYVHQMGEYSGLALNAPSVFQLVPYGMAVNDDLLAKLGIAAASALVMALLAVGYLLRGRLTPKAALCAAVLLATGIPFFLPHMHERYFFLADVLSVCLACAIPWCIPAAVLTCGSSLACYLVYLRLQFNQILTLGAHQFVMPLEMLTMLMALIISIVTFILQTKQDRSGLA